MPRPSKVLLLFTLFELFATYSQATATASSTRKTSRGRSVSGRNFKDGWRQIGTSVKRSVSSSVSIADLMDDVSLRSDGLPTGPPLDLDYEMSTRGPSLFNGKRQSQHFERNPHPIGPPGSSFSPFVNPPAFGPPAGPPSSRPFGVHSPAPRPPGAGPASLRPPGAGPPSLRPPNARPPGVGPPSLRPPEPPGIGSSSPGRPTPGPSFVRPPSRPGTGPTFVAPPSIGPPSPQSLDVEVTGIRCVMGRQINTLVAILKPPSNYMTIPVLQDSPSIDLRTDPYCALNDADNDQLLYQLLITDFSRCGVEDCSDDSEKKFCITLRFPLVDGLQLPEDEILTIKCEPQDPVAEDTHVVQLPTSPNINLEREESLFEGGGQSFQCEIAIYQRHSQNSDFTSRVMEGMELDLGQEVQLWSIVRANDGWRFSQLVDVVVHSDISVKERSNKNTAVLVDEKGCNNPQYLAIAPGKPEPEPSNMLLNRFTFRVFLFQNMAPGESMVITAKVIGCVEEEDCMDTRECTEFSTSRGRRRKRNVQEVTFTTTFAPTESSSSASQISDSFRPSPSKTRENNENKEIPSTTASPKLQPPPGIIHSVSQYHHGMNSTTDWQRSLSIKVKNPNSSLIKSKPLPSPQCQVYLFLTVGVAAAFFFATVVFVIVVLAKKRSQLKQHLLTTKSSTPATSTSSMHIKPVFEQKSNQKKQLNKTLSSFETRNSSSSQQSHDSVTSVSDSEEDGQQQMTWMPQVLVPATVRQRKRQVNSELMETFKNGTMPLPSCPPLLNYYGYMVVPTKAAANGHSASVKSKSSRKRHKSPHSTLDRKFDPNLIFNSNAWDDDSSSEQTDDYVPNKSHRDRYRRRQQKYSEQHQTKNNFCPRERVGNCVSKIQIEGPPSLPPQRPLPRNSQTVGGKTEDNIYDLPFESRPVMV